MPIKTPHYELTAFTNGDAFSASADRRRFTIIDNQFEFLASQITDGIISGWEVTSAGGRVISVSEGMGIVDGFVAITLGSLEIELVNNDRSYVWMRRKTAMIGERGAFCPIASIAYTDTTIPATPATPTASDTTFSTITITWTANSEADLDHYDVYRSTDNVTYAKIGETTTNSYVDEGLDDDTTYYYKVLAADVNANVSSLSGALTTATDTDSTVPADPSEVEVIGGNEQIQLLWNPSLSNIDAYVIRVLPLDTEGLPDADAYEYELDASDTFYVIPDLTNAKRYEITLYSVTEAGVRSGGVVVFGIPTFDNGPEQIIDVIASDRALDTSGNVAIDLSWDAIENDYLLPPEYYYVTVTTGSQTGEPSIYTENDITIVQYSTTDGTVHKIREDTTYTIVVQGVTESGITNKGMKIRFTTDKFTSPSPPTDIDVDGEFGVNERFVRASWTNSKSAFSYNSLTINRISLDSETPNIAIVTDLNINKATRYEVPSSFIVNQARYEFIVVAIDHAGNESDSLTGSVVLARNLGLSGTSGGGTTIDGGFDRPGAPTQIDAIGGDYNIRIFWNQYESLFVASYKVYRAVFAQSYSVDDFEHVATVNDETFTWTDYDVENGTRYAYTVTVVDTLGNESLNPDDDYFDFNLAVASPRSINTLDRAPDISLIASGHDVIIEWAQEDGEFDGFEIWRSDTNDYSFRKVGAADSDDISYTDEDALLENGTYYYMIRKYRNEAELVVTLDEISPVGAILLATVTVIGNAISDINDEAANIILNLEDPIRNETREQLALPHHPYISSTDDRRIRLQEKLVVTDWTTDDFITYTTETNIQETDEFTVFINGSQSSFNASIDEDEQTLTFETAIYDESSDEDEPTIKVIFTGISEVQNTLAPKFIEDINAVKFQKGKFLNERLSNIDHFGRYREPLDPIREGLAYSDGWHFECDETLSTTFYDILKTVDGELLAATSKGVLLNDGEGGNVWTTVLRRDLPVTKLFYSAIYGWYLAAIGNVVYYSEADDLTTWLPIDGMKGVNIIRDFAADEGGYIYASTDAGVHWLNPENTIKLIWEQASLINVQDNNAYALLYDGDNILVSGFDGIYESNNTGITWTRTDDESITVPAYSLVLTNGYLFALTKSNVWRRRTTDDQFEQIYSSVDICRHLVVYDDTLYITTNKTLLRSDDSQNIYTANTLDFRIGFSAIVRQLRIPPVTTVKAIDSKLYIGTDGRLYSSDTSRKLLLHADLPGAAPTIYVDDKERAIGVYYSTEGHVLFDEYVSPLSTVEIVTNYQTLKARNGGWASIKYDATVFVHLDGILTGAGKPSTLANDVANAVKGITLASFNARNSNYDTALAALKAIVAAINEIDNLETDEEVSSTTIANVFDLIDTLNANVHPELRNTFDLSKIEGVLKQVPDEQATSTVNRFDISLSTLTTSIGSFDAVNGTVTIDTITLDKYSLVEISIREVGVTNIGKLQHEEVENIFEEFNSGLGSSFSQVQQGNVLHLMTFNKKTWPNGEDGVIPKYYQSTSSIPCNSDWYDTLRSTVDYSLETEQTPQLLDLPYPADVLHLPDRAEVWVCGLKGIIAVNTSTYRTKKVFLHSFYIYNMHRDGNTVYALAEDGLYTVNLVDESVTKDVTIDLPDGYNSVFFINDNILIATSDGLMLQRPYDDAWTKVVDVKDGFVRSDGTFSFTAGKDPEATGNGQVYYATFGGASWSRSATFESILINGVTRRFDVIYYATDSGLYREDLSRLYSNSQFSQPIIDLVDLKNNEDDSEELQINDVHSDDERVIVGDFEGNFYTIDGGDIVETESQLPTIHKVRLVNGNYWLFGHDMIEIEGLDRLVQLSSGRATT